MSEDTLKIGHLSFVLSKYAQEEWEKEKVSINWVNHSTDHFHPDSEMEEGIGREGAIRIVKMLSDVYSINSDTERIRLLELIQKQASHDMKMASERANLIAENNRLKDLVRAHECKVTTSEPLKPSIVTIRGQVADPLPEWKERFIHVAEKCAIVIGLNNQERAWVREAGFDCPDEADDEDED